MQHKKTLIILLAALLSGYIVFIPSTFAQTELGKKQKSPQFGWSVKEKSKNEKIPTSNRPQSKIADDEIIRVETNLVRTDVLVVNKNGNLVLGLQAKDFLITENGVEQEVTTFSGGDNADIPRSIVLIIDYSGSQLQYIRNSVKAAKVLISKLNPKDKMAIVTDDIELLTPFTQNKEKLKNKLDIILAKVEGGQIGKSQQYSALMASLNELFTAEDVRRIVIFQTDGDQLFRIKPEEPKPNQSPKSFDTTFNDRELIEAIQRSEATIYSIYSGFSLFGLTPEERIKKTILMGKRRYTNYHPNNLAYPIESITDGIFRLQQGMKVIAEASGGYISMLEGDDDADLIYSTILLTMQNRYLIGFYPTNQEHDGKQRNVKIEVRGHPEFKVFGQKTYFAAKQH